MNDSQLNIHPTVKTALEKGKPVVALESTLITHGFPHPDNIEIALGMEDAIRKEGAIPTTIAIIHGQITVGLTAEQIKYLGTADQVRKCSTRDLPIAVARHENGSTTVASTMRIAHWVGINLFATGGIGGVHRGHPFDTSADLLTLGKVPMTVVCAGAKAILDLPTTLEVLETQSVPVIGYQTDQLPAFYSRSSGLPVDVRIDTPGEAVDIITARDNLGLKSGILITNPIPMEEEWPADEAQSVIEKAMTEATTQQITGKAVTPFLLNRVNELSDGTSKAANTALLLNNARLAAKIAVTMANRKAAIV